MSTQNKKVDMKLVLLLVIPLALLLIGLVLYKKYYVGENTEGAKAMGTIPIPETKVDTMPTSKVAVYLAERKRKEAENSERKEEVSVADFYKLALEKEREVEKEKQEEPKRTEIPEPPSPSPAPKRAYQRPQPAEEKPKVEAEVAVEAVPAPPVESAPKRAKRGGFGIVKGEQNYTPPQSAEPVAEVKKDTEGYIPILLEENSVIKQETNVVFVLLADTRINSIDLKKNSYLFGKANDSGTYFDIALYEAKNVDGKVYDLRGAELYVFNEKYSRGLPHEGKLNEAVKEGVRETGSQGTGVTSTSSIVNNAMGVVDRTVKGIARNRENSITLGKGYRLFIKKVK